MPLSKWIMLQSKYVHKGRPYVVAFLLGKQVIRVLLCGFKSYVKRLSKKIKIWIPTDLQLVKCQKSKKELEWNELGLFWHRLFTTKNEVDLLHLKVDTRKIVPKRCFHLFAALNLILLDKISFAHKWVLCELFRSQKWCHRIC